MRLRTERLILREYTMDDFAAVHTFASDERVAEFVEWGPNTESDTRGFLESCVQAQGASPRVDFTLAVAAPLGGPLGTVGLTLAHGHGELGYVIAPDHWGSGYATEAASALLAFGLDEQGLQSVSATCRPENAASARVLSKIGMSCKGLRRADRLIRGQWRDSLVFAVSRPTARPLHGT